MKGRGTTAGKGPKAWALPRIWVSIRSYKKQQVRILWGRILGLDWLKFAVAPRPWIGVALTFLYICVGVYFYMNEPLN